MEAVFWESFAFSPYKRESAAGSAQLQWLLYVPSRISELKCLPTSNGATMIFQFII